jgi:competence protein ComEA
VAAWLERYKLLLLALAAALLVSTIAVRGMAGGASEPIVFDTVSRLPEGTPIRVHVAGEVARAGVYEMREGDRVIDAIDAAGGATAGADSNALNLARRLRDGEQLVIPNRSAVRSISAAVPTLAPGQRLDLNTATEAQLNALPGIGAAYSRRIVDSRAVDGPFKSVDDLLTRRILSASTLDGIRDLVSTGP